MHDDQLFFENGTFSEAELESAIIELFGETGYEWLDGESIHRELTEVLIKDDLESFLRARYLDSQFTDIEFEKIVARLELGSTGSLYEQNKDAFLLVTEGFNFIRDDASLPAVHINFIDFENPINNSFKVVSQYSVQGKLLRRPDLLIFINGIPVGICEFKTSIDETKTIYDAWEQITIRYKRDIPDLLKYCFLSVISDGSNTKLGSIFTPYEYYYAWNKANEVDTVANGISSLFTMIEGAFAPERILQILRDFVFYPDESSNNLAMVCRYPQFFAARNMLASIRDHMRPHGDGKGGVYFGATGSGKTMTMLYLSRLLTTRYPKTFKNPTVIAIVDREDLDSQTSQVFVSAKRFLHDDDVRSIETREDLRATLLNKPSGGVYITTIQKFSESTGLLSDRSNIICISDEAHRSQAGLGPKDKKTKEGIKTTYGFAKYLRDSFPNATYCGVTGTPVDETTAVFGEIVDSYTMRQSTEDGITVRIAYEPRLARVIMSGEKAKEIQEYYDDAAERGASDEAIETSQKAMSAMKRIIGDDDRLEVVAQDIVTHYEAITSEKPEVVQKAMIVCLDREIAFQLLKNIRALRPDWAVPRKAAPGVELSEEQADELIALPKVNLVATQGQNDSKDLFEEAGTKEYRKMLDAQFKNEDSNFTIAVVVDMWITGFDVPSLSVMYIDKPLQRHTLIQTISRVNRVFEGKDKGLVIDYFGIYKKLMEALKMYGGGKKENPVDNIEFSVKTLQTQLEILDDLFAGFDSTDYFIGAPLNRLKCLNRAAEYIQRVADEQKRFMLAAKQMKAAYQLASPSGKVSDNEAARAQFYMAVRSLVFKQTKGDAPDAETMNAVVEKMVAEAITATGVESIIDSEKETDLFSDDVLDRLESLNLPITKFNALLKLLKQSINQYRKTNKVQAAQFEERLRGVVDRYNKRDDFVHVSEVTHDFVDQLSDELLDLLNELHEDQNSFKQLGISYEEKAFYDILIKVRDDHDFEYADEKCVVLAAEIKMLVEDKSQYADWSTRGEIQSALNRDITVLLYKNGYPPQWNKEVFERVMEQTTNFKKYEG